MRINGYITELSLRGAISLIFWDVNRICLAKERQNIVLPIPMFKGDEFEQWSVIFVAVTLFWANAVKTFLIVSLWQVWPGPNTLTSAWIDPFKEVQNTPSTLRVSEIKPNLSMNWEVLSLDTVAHSLLSLVWCSFSFLLVVCPPSRVVVYWIPEAGIQKISSCRIDVGW